MTIIIIIIIQNIPHISYPKNHGDSKSGPDDGDVWWVRGTGGRQGCLWGETTRLCSPHSVTEHASLRSLLYVHVPGEFYFWKDPRLNFLFQKKCWEQRAGGWRVQDEYSSCKCADGNGKEKTRNIADPIAERTLKWKSVRSFRWVRAARWKPARQSGSACAMPRQPHCAL